MPLWSEILKELQPPAPNTPPDFDGVRRQYLGKLHNYTERNVILYASGWLQKETAVQSEAVSIDDGDIQALMEVTARLEGDSLDLILHSPGGSAESAEAIVSYLRSRFSHIRVIVPQEAMSAATMLACATDEIVLGKHSFLGPTDPQIILPTNTGARVIPAQDILDQFDKAWKNCAKDPTQLSVWVPILSQYDPGLLVQCESVLKLSRELVQTWLTEYMFKGTEDGEEKAREIAEWLADHTLFKSHNRHIPREQLQSKGLKIVELESDDRLQDLSLSVFHAATHTFTGTSATKIVENHTGRAFIKHSPIMPPLL